MFVASLRYFNIKITVKNKIHLLNTNVSTNNQATTFQNRNKRQQK